MITKRKRVVINSLYHGGLRGVGKTNVNATQTTVIFICFPILSLSFTFALYIHKEIARKKWLDVPIANGIWNSRLIWFEQILFHPIRRFISRAVNKHLVWLFISPFVFSIFIPLFVDFFSLSLSLFCFSFIYVIWFLCYWFMFICGQTKIANFISFQVYVYVFYFILCCFIIEGMQPCVLGSNVDWKRNSITCMEVCCVRVCVCVSVFVCVGVCVYENYIFILWFQLNFFFIVFITIIIIHFVFDWYFYDVNSKRKENVFFWNSILCFFCLSKRTSQMGDIINKTVAHIL